jgi:hypothetical protein
MKFKNLLKEIIQEIGEGGKVYPYTFIGFNSGKGSGPDWGFEYSFEGPDQEYQVNGNYFDKKDVKGGNLTVEFSPSNSHPNVKTGAGKPLSVINTVVEILREFITSKSPEVVNKIHFYAGRKRNKIYKRFVTKKFPNAQVFVDDGTFVVLFKSNE